MIPKSSLPGLLKETEKFPRKENVEIYVIQLTMSAIVLQT